ncbi:hypothetical protein [Mycolicibacterium gilvum]
MTRFFPSYAAINAESLRAFSSMAFKLTYSDGQESQHDDDTVWEIDDGVLKLGRKKDEWSVYLSPSHWAVLELGGGASKDDDDTSDKKDDKKSDEGKTDEKDRDAKNEDDNTDDEKNGDKDDKDD